MTSLGAQLAVDYHDESWQAKIAGWCPGGVVAAIAMHSSTAVDCQVVVKDGGVIVAVSGDQLATERSIRLEQIPHMGDVKTELVELMGHIADESMQLVIEKVYPLESGLEALEKVKTRHARGKIVLELKNLA